MILHKLNPGKGVSWCGEKHYYNSMGFVRRWKFCTCTECLKYSSRDWYKVFVKPIRKGTPKKVDTITTNQDVSPKNPNEINEL